jgi:hypothetical protein
MHLPSSWRFAGLAVGRRADLLSAACGAHDAGESRVAVRGAGSAARGDRTRSQSQGSSSQRSAAERCCWSSFPLVSPDDAQMLAQPEKAQAWRDGGPLPVSTGHTRHMHFRAQARRVAAAHVGVR